MSENTKELRNFARLHYRDDLSGFTVVTGSGEEIEIPREIIIEAVAALVRESKLRESEDKISEMSNYELLGLTTPRTRE